MAVCERGIYLQPVPMYESYICLVSYSQLMLLLEGLYPTAHKLCPFSILRDSIRGFPSPVWFYVYCPYSACTLSHLYQTTCFLIDLGMCFMHGRPVPGVNPYILPAERIGSGKSNYHTITITTTPFCATERAFKEW